MEHAILPPQVVIGVDVGGTFIAIVAIERGAKIVRSEKAPMHIHEFSLNEKADRIFAVGHNKLTRWELEA